MRVGITGHQRLEDPREWLWVEDMMRRELRRISPQTGVTSLAIGADQLFARLVLELGGVIHAVLPFPEIERTFSPHDLASYREFLRQATIEIMDAHGTDEDAYLAAGQRVVQLSEIMLAVWDGKSRKGRGGTSDVVRYAVHLGVPLVHIDPILRSVRHWSPRSGSWTPKS